MSKRSKRRHHKQKAGPANQQAGLPHSGPMVPAGGIVPGGTNGTAVVKQTVSYAATFSGPIPPPNLLADYEGIEPGLAGRIVKMAEDQSAHRQSLEKKVVDSDIIKSYCGLAAAFVLAMTSIVGGALLVYGGHDSAGAVIATSVVVALAGLFLKETNARKVERAEKSQAVTPTKPGGKPAGGK